ncbi:MAG: hypothetical protein U0K65_06040 [Negativibacillus sp.]|nr:hypothetical protein [Negativibacillus sp.]
MPVKKARALRDRLLIAGFVVMLLAYVYRPLFYVGGAIAFSCLIPHFLFNRCPHCGKQLGRNEGDFCQYCGKRID